MPARVIAISRTAGAGAEAVARAVASKLGFRYVDEDVVARAAAMQDVDPELVADVEARKPLLVRLLRDLGSSAERYAYPMFVPTSRETGGTGATSDDVRALIREAVHELAGQGELVIVAHAASMALMDRDDVLRVLVTASEEVRARRVAADDGMSVDEAAKAVRSSDRARADYFKRFYEIDRELPTHYDLVVNTDRMTPDGAAGLVTAAAAA